MIREKQKIHYSWVMAFAGFMIFAVNFCIVFNCVGVFAQTVSQDLGILRKQFSLNNTIINLLSMAVALLFGKIYKKFTLKQILLFGALLCPAAYFMYSQAQNIRTFYIISAFVGIGAACNGMIPVSLLITNWFNQKRGLAMGIAFTGSGAGGIILNPVFAAFMQKYGWRATYMFASALMVAIILPIVLFLIKSKPQDIGYLPYGGYNDSSAGQLIQEETGIAVEQAVKSLKFWAFMLYPILIGSMSAAMIQQTVPFAQSLGYAATKAALIGSLSMTSLAVGKITIGKIYDIKSVKFTTITAVLTFIISLFLYCTGQNFLFTIGVIISGFGSSLSSVSYPILTQKFFGRKDYAAVYGYVSVSAGFGVAMGPMIVSSAYDTYGSFIFGWLVLAIMGIVSLGTVLLLDKIKE